MLSLHRVVRNVPEAKRKLINRSRKEKALQVQNRPIVFFSFPPLISAYLAITNFFFCLRQIESCLRVPCFCKNNLKKKDLYSRAQLSWISAPVLLYFMTWTFFQFSSVSSCNKKKTLVLLGTKPSWDCKLMEARVVAAAARMVYLLSILF